MLTDSQTPGPEKMIVFEDMIVVEVIGWGRGGRYWSWVSLYFVIISVLNKGSGMYTEAATWRLERRCHRAELC